MPQYVPTAVSSGPQVHYVPYSNPGLQNLEGLASLYGTYQQGQNLKQERQLREFQVMNDIMQADPAQRQYLLDQARKSGWKNLPQQAPLTNLDKTYLDAVNGMGGQGGGGATTPSTAAFQNPMGFNPYASRAGASAQDMAQARSAMAPMASTATPPPTTPPTQTAQAAPSPDGPQPDGVSEPVGLFGGRKPQPPAPRPLTTTPASASPQEYTGQSALLRAMLLRSMATGKMDPQQMMQVMPLISMPPEQMDKAVNGMAIMNGYAPPSITFNQWSMGRMAQVGAPQVFDSNGQMLPEFAKAKSSLEDAESKDPYSVMFWEKHGDGSMRVFEQAFNIGSMDQHRRTMADIAKQRADSQVDLNQARATYYGQMPQVQRERIQAQEQIAAQKLEEQGWSHETAQAMAFTKTRVQTNLNLATQWGHTANALMRNDPTSVANQTKVTQAWNSFQHTISGLDAQKNSLIRSATLGQNIQTGPDGKPVIPPEVQAQIAQIDTRKQQLQTQFQQQMGKSLGPSAQSFMDTLLGNGPVQDPSNAKGMTWQQALANQLKAQQEATNAITEGRSQIDKLNQIEEKRRGDFYRTTGTPMAPSAIDPVQQFDKEVGPQPGGVSGDVSLEPPANSTGTPAPQGNTNQSSVDVDGYKFNPPTKLPQQFLPAVQKYGTQFDPGVKNLDFPRLVASVMSVESSFNPNAKSPTGALGLMQLEPDTAAGLGVKNPLDPEQNVAGGARYLAQMLKAFKGNPTLAIAAYNAGPGAVQKSGGIPNIKETQDYVKRVNAVYHSGRLPSLTQDVRTVHGGNVNVESPVDVSNVGR